MLTASLVIALEAGRARPGATRPEPASPSSSR